MPPPVATSRAEIGSFARPGSSMPPRRGSWASRWKTSIFHLPDELEYLNRIATDDEPLAALIAVHKARAAPYLPDLEQAEKHLRVAETVARTPMNVKTASVNVRVQRARVALVADAAASLDEAHGASAERRPP